MGDTDGYFARGLKGGIMSDTSYTASNTELSVTVRQDGGVLVTRLAIGQRDTASRFGFTADEWSWLQDTYGRLIDLGKAR